MKNKISKILGIGLSIMMLTSLMVIVPPAPVSAGTLSFSSETIPSLTGNLLVPAGEDIVDLAVVDKTVYAAMGTANKLYKSKDVGATWDEISLATKPASSLPNLAFNLIAAAPDDANLVALVTGSLTVEFSEDGGATFTDLGKPTGISAIRSIDVSEERSGANYIAIAGDNVTSGNTYVYTIKLATAETWSNRLSVPKGFKAGQTRVNAVKFSASFSEDRILTVVSSTNLTATFQILAVESPYYWNDNVTGYDDYTNGIPIATTAANLDSASIVMPSTYTGFEATERNAFVGLAWGTTLGGVFRLTDTQVDPVTTWSGGNVGAIRSLAYNDAEKLVAGKYNSTEVLSCIEPYVNDPEFQKPTVYKQPGGGNLAVVRFSGDTVVAGTSGTSSAFAVSTDGGLSFNDIGLIDTTITALNDVTPAKDNSRIYLVSNGGGVTSLWLFTTTWKRVFSVTDTRYIARLSPANAKVIYIADIGGVDLYFSDDGGEKTWKKRPVYKLDDLVDLEVESDLVAYAIDSDESSKTTNGGSTWGSEKSLGITGAATMITQAPGGDLFVGGTNGIFAKSTDKAATWDQSEKTPENLTTGSNLQIVADADYATNKIIYVSTQASGKKGIYRADANNLVDPGFSSTRGISETSTPAIPATGMISGMVIHTKVLYAIYYLSTTANTSELRRCLEPNADPVKYASRTISDSVEFDVTPRALKVSDGIKLWAISSKPTPALYSLTDAIATAAPKVSAPAAGFEVPMNPITGHSYDVTFSFDRQNSKVTKIELNIATDSKGLSVVYKGPVGNIETKEQTTNFITVGPGGDTGYKFEFLPGQTYYWRVRTAVDGPFYSPWSALTKLTVGPAIGFAIIGPAVGSVGVPLQPTFSWKEYPGAIRYEIMVSEDPTFTVIEYSHTVTALFYKGEETLAYNRTYYWRVRGVTGEPAKSGEPAVGGPWQGGVFTTMPEPTTTPPVVITIPGPVSPPTISVITVPIQQPASIPSYLLWAIIAIGAVLVIALIVLIVRTRRVS